ncbi:MAG: DUF6675 family protein [Treponemataceae bacterium]
MKNRFIKVCFVSFFFTKSLFAEDSFSVLSSILPEDIAKNLSVNKKLELISYNKEGFSPSMMPKTALGDEIKTSWENSPKPTFVVESLYVMPKEKNTAIGSDIERISKITRSISLLTQSQYYSHSRKAMRDLYEESYVVADKKSKERLADPLDGDADGMQITVVQKDSTFGRFVYEYTYRQTKTEVGFHSTNIDALWYSIFKIIEPQKLNVSLVVNDLGSCLVTYVLFQADFLPISAVENKITRSLTARTNALYDWFQSQYTSFTDNL